MNYNSDTAYNNSAVYNSTASGGTPKGSSISIDDPNCCNCGCGTACKGVSLPAQVRATVVASACPSLIGASKLVPLQCFDGDTRIGYQVQFDSSDENPTCLAESPCLWTSDGGQWQLTDVEGCVSDDCCCEYPGNSSSFPFHAGCPSPHVGTNVAVGSAGATVTTNCIATVRYCRLSAAAIAPTDNAGTKCAGDFLNTITHQPPGFTLSDAQYYNYVGGWEFAGNTDVYIGCPSGVAPCDCSSDPNVHLGGCPPGGPYGTTFSGAVAFSAA